MTNAGPNHQPGIDEFDAAMTLQQEQVRVATEWVASGSARISRRVVSETRMVEVTVRREELVVETDAAVAAHGAMVGTVLDGPVVDAPAASGAPIVLVLREELPEVVTRVYPYERVTVRVDLAETRQQVDSQVRSEAVDYAVHRSSE